MRCRLCRKMDPLFGDIAAILYFIVSDSQHGMLSIPNSIQNGRRTVINYACSCIFQVGYNGTQCEQCADGYFGNPLVPGGRCQLCACNDNIDPSNFGNCDTLTGRCLACLYNTAGFSCERCKSGYYGDAIVRNCTSK